MYLEKDYIYDALDLAPAQVMGVSELHIQCMFYKPTDESAEISEIKIYRPDSDDDIAESLEAVDKDTYQQIRDFCLREASDIDWSEIESDARADHDYETYKDHQLND